MEKTKKLSKSSIAVIVLAILLALSMIMGITGAWFTDQNRTSDTDTMTFGKVTLGALGANEYKIQEWAGTSEGKLVPGSSVHVNGGTLQYTCDVKAYVFAFTTTITINGKEYDGNWAVISKW